MVWQVVPAGMCRDIRHSGKHFIRPVVSRKKRGFSAHFGPGGACRASRSAFFKGETLQPLKNSCPWPVSPLKKRVGGRMGAWGRITGTPFLRKGLALARSPRGFPSPRKNDWLHAPAEQGGGLFCPGFGGRGRACEKGKALLACAAKGAFPPWQSCPATGRFPRRSDSRRGPGPRCRRSRLRHGRGSCRRRCRGNGTWRSGRPRTLSCP